MSEGGWGPPQPIPASYYAREAIAPPGRLALWLASLRGLKLATWVERLPQIGRLGGSQRLAAAAAAGGVLLLVGVFAVLAQGSPRKGTVHVTAQPPRPPAAAAAVPAPSTTILPTDTPTSAPSAAPTRSPTPSSRPTTEPTVTILNGPLSARRGHLATLRARTLPGTACSAVLGYALAPRLPPAGADDSGLVSWTWQVNFFAPKGTWPISVTCGGAAAATEITIS